MAIVLDICSRRVIGWSMSAHRDDHLVLTALEMALAARRPTAELLHHSDRGSQYTSHHYQELLASWGIEVNMSRKGDCYDRQSWPIMTQARQVICEFGSGEEGGYMVQWRHGTNNMPSLPTD